VDPRPLAHPPRRGRVTRAALLVAGAALLASAAPGHAEPGDLAPTAPLAAYHEAARLGALGGVAGQAQQDGPRPGDPPRPRAGVDVVLLPWSGALVRALEDVRRRAREDEQVYRTAGRRLATLRQAYEQSLRAHGAADLVRTTTTGADGAFALEDVPAGRWLLVAEFREHVRTRHAGRPTRRDKIFGAPPRLEGYRVTTVWLRELVLAPGHVERVELTERGAWMRAVDEERRDGG